MCSKGPIFKKVKIVNLYSLIFYQLNLSLQRFSGELWA